MMNRFALLGVVLAIGCDTPGFEETPLAAPAALEGKSFGASRVDLTWTASGGDGYTVERSTDGTTFEVMDDVHETAYADVRLSPSTKYSYRVRSHRSDRWSDPSTVVDVTTGEMGWSRLDPPSPKRLGSPTAIYASKEERMLVFGSDGDETRNLLSLDLKSKSSTWKDISSSMNPKSFPPVIGQTTIYDDSQNRMVLFGGAFSGASTTYTLQALSLPPDPTVAADRLVAQGWVLPGSRADHTAIYDSTFRRMVIYGGYTFALESVSGTLMDTWSIDLPPPGVRPTWQLLCTGPPRSGHSAIYDGANRRMIVFGGIDTTYRNDVWELSLPEYRPYLWRKVEVDGDAPAPRSGHVAIYDSANRRMVVFGGKNKEGYFNDVWSLSLSGPPAWNKLTPTGTPPSGRADLAAIFDEINRRMILYGGRVALSGPLRSGSETWFLGL